MNPSPDHDTHYSPWQNKERPHPARYWLVLIIFLALAVFLLWEEHQAHMIGVLPWLLLLALCPLMHVFMHGGHGHGNHNGHDNHPDQNRER